MNRFSRLALMMHDHLAGPYGKMGHGLLRYSEAAVVAVVDRATVGRTVREVTGIDRDVPIVATVAEAVAVQGADTLVLGVATAGGVLPGDWWDEMEVGLAAGMSLVNGLHAPLADHPRLRPALQPGRTIWDVRQEPPGLANGTGAARNLSAKRVLTVGTDMAIGKMTASIELDRAARRRGLSLSVSRVGPDRHLHRGRGRRARCGARRFCHGRRRQLVMRHGADNDILWVEGQGSILHPASTAWLALLRGSCPTHLILCHRAGQAGIARQPWVKIPPLRDVAALYEAVAAGAGALPAARTAGIALNTAHLDDAAARQAIDQASAESGLPATDVVRFGPDVLLDAIL